MKKNVIYICTMSKVQLFLLYNYIIDIIKLNKNELES